MATTELRTKQIATRFLCSAGTAIAFGFLLFRVSIFVPSMTSFQFVITGITIALFHSVLRSLTIRNALVALLVWYFVSLAFFEPQNRWMYLANLAYIVGVSGAYFLSILFVTKSNFKNAITRVLSLTVILAIVNALIMAFLLLFSWHVVITHTERVLRAILSNAKLGALIGVGLGIGIEIAEHIITRHFDDKAHLSEALTNAT